ncbi:hypothetical protein [Herbaspirillum autotrophicum]|uniref:hypothetical protein n=1 Tax=Herbaspirillum autotrophicum TaxID=180195 RepID=UPI0018DD12CB|nr:hypothetical protein [Herbaspirillum autotrophicum]
MAEMQLDQAIRLFIDEKDYISSATLAGAAEEIFGSLLKREGIPNALDQLFANWSANGAPEIPSPEFRKALNNVRNQLKHAGDPAFDEMEVRNVDSMLLIARAAGMHPSFSDAPTQQLIRFREWWEKNAETLISTLPEID